MLSPFFACVFPPPPRFSVLFPFFLLYSPAFAFPFSTFTFLAFFCPALLLTPLALCFFLLLSYILFLAQLLVFSVLDPFIDLGFPLFLLFFLFAFCFPLFFPSPSPFSPL